MFMHIEQTQHILSAQAFRQDYYYTLSTTSTTTKQLHVTKWLNRWPQPLLLSACSSQRIRLVFFWFFPMNETNLFERIVACKCRFEQCVLSLIRKRLCTHTDMSQERHSLLCPHVLQSYVFVRFHESSPLRNALHHPENIQCKIGMLVDAWHSNLRMYFVFVVRWFWHSVFPIFNWFNSNVVSLPSTAIRTLCSNRSTRNYVPGINWWMENFEYEYPTLCCCGKIYHAPCEYGTCRICLLGVATQIRCSFDQNKMHCFVELNGRSSQFAIQQIARNKQIHTMVVILGAHLNRIYSLPFSWTASNGWIWE